MDPLRQRKAEPNASSHEPGRMTTARRRRPRLSDAETEARMLAAGLSVLTERGLSISLDHVVMEDIIREAGVSRTSVYRRWPYRELFHTDLLAALAEHIWLAGGSQETADELHTMLTTRAGELRTDGGRRRLLVDGLRVSLQGNVDDLAASPQWQSYLALEASLPSLPEVERERIGATLAAQDERFVKQRADVYRELLGVIGYRLSPPLDGDEGLRVLSSATGAMMIGFLLKGAASPDSLRPSVRIAALGGSEADWSVPVLAIATTFLAMVEPDPEGLADPETLPASLDAMSRRYTR